MTSLYLASPLSTAVRMSNLARDMRALGFKVWSRWHEQYASFDAEHRVDPMDDGTRALIVAQNIAEIRLADVTVVVTSMGDGRATYGDAAFALALCKPIVWVHGRDGTGRCVWDSHSLCSRIIDPQNERRLPEMIAGAIRRAVAA
jgi:nucleoside 2-deoxyribosyltransferase